MELNSQRIGDREKMILVGLYLSKYDLAGLKRLGFDSFIEAFNVIAYALRAKPASIKNYRDEFDPLFPNPRKGWRKRQTRDYCTKVYNAYKNLDIDTFTALVKSISGYDENAWSEFQSKDKSLPPRANFAQRLITGLAAEQYFETVQPTLAEFREYKVQNTTRLGCGYDFRLDRESTDEFLAIEVKGLKEAAGTVSFTPKEYQSAEDLQNRFFLFVVKNFAEAPFHQIFCNPLACNLHFVKQERIIVQQSWIANV